jgi:protein gp37
VPFFFKGWGGPRPTSGGRLLDGREWSEMPTWGLTPLATITAALAERTI